MSQRIKHCTKQHRSILLFRYALDFSQPPLSYPYLFISLGDLYLKLCVGWL